MKKQTLLLSVSLAMLLTASAQTPSAQTAAPTNSGQLPPPPRMEGREMKQERQDLRDDRAQIKEQRGNLMEKRIELHASNTAERKDLRKEMQDGMRNATSPEARREILGDMKDKARDMHASNTAERKELREEAKQIVKERTNAAIERLGLVAGHFENALARYRNY